MRWEREIFRYFDRAGASAGGVFFFFFFSENEFLRYPSG